MTSIKSLISAAPSSNQSFTFARLYGDFFGANTANFSSLVLIAQHYNQATPAGLWYADCYDTGELDFDDLAAVGADLNQREAAANSGAGKFKGVGGNSKGSGVFDCNRRLCLAIRMPRRPRVSGKFKGVGSL